VGWEHEKECYIKIKNNKVERKEKETLRENSREEEKEDRK
jgi:hypothetical protein